MAALLPGPNILPVTGQNGTGGRLFHPRRFTDSQAVFKYCLEDCGNWVDKLPLAAPKDLLDGLLTLGLAWL